MIRKLSAFLTMIIRKLLTCTQMNSKIGGTTFFSFCIPVPTGRDRYGKISIEFYYSDEELKIPESNTGKRLFFSNEVHKIINTTNDKIDKIVALDFPIQEDEFSKKIFDKDCADIEDQNGDKVAISKSVFADLVTNKREGFNNMNFENFRLIFDVIEKILEK